ncbi:uncharacterized protein PAC_00107 [Phialocephala subalpina]|uniref:Fungal N-terminal domain-containing protein n=1 Tax=Phialocephala subalpina TaxID=576137 RepID=A0A1L7WBT2_9HELO|nr:uncharacterized protein PAC_00107 [Phialocephala subalpina]
MDPLTAIGAVASIWQIAQAALSLSKTLYTLGAAVGSASEDIQLLADDLKTFSQSLTLLSRLLEDSKSWYSDDIYLLTAKIIKDCADLYVKIDKILEKLGGNGKRTWKVRMKFVYKESQIQKLLSRLRDMKGTLATILMSLQVDLQLSLLNISSTSKIQRPPERPLQPETLRVLQEANKLIMAGGTLTKYTISSKETVQVSERGVHVSTTHCRMQQSEPQSGFSALSTTARSILDPPQLLGHSNVFNTTQSFVVLPSNANAIPPVIKRDLNSASLTRLVSSSIKALDGGKPTKSPSSPRYGSSTQPLDNDHAATRSLKSSSSAESFKSAISIQEQDLEVARKVKAVQSVLHAFRTAIQILGNLIESRLSGTDEKLFSAAKGLEQSLAEGSNRINRHHMNHFKQYGQAYLELFGPAVSDKIQLLGSELMKNVVMKLHEYSAEYEDLYASQFEHLSRVSKDVSLRTSHHLTRLASGFGSNAQSIYAEIPRMEGINWFAQQNNNEIAEPKAVNDIWERVQSLPAERGDEIDLDRLCEGLRKKTKAAEAGAVINESDFNKIMESYVDRKPAKLNHDDDEMPELFYHPGMSGRPLDTPLPAVPQLPENRSPPLLPAGWYRSAREYGHLHPSAVDGQQRHVAYPSQSILIPSAQYVPRSSSLSGHSAAPQISPATRQYVVPPPPPMSPPAQQHMMNILPPPPPPNVAPQSYQHPGVTLLPPPGPPPVANWQGSWGRSYDARGFPLSPPFIRHDVTKGRSLPPYHDSLSASSTLPKAYSTKPVSQCIYVPDTSGTVDDDDSDLEAAAGLEAMRIAEEQLNALDTSDSNHKSLDLGWNDACVSYGEYDVGDKHPYPAFEEDIDFTATTAAGLQDTGFDPNIVINDTSFRRHEAPPVSNSPWTYDHPLYAETAVKSVDVCEEENVVLPDIHSDLEEDYEEDESVPSWAKDPDLQKSLLAQETMDPTAIFRHADSPSMDELFGRQNHRSDESQAPIKSGQAIDAKANLEVKEDKKADGESDAKEDIDAEEESEEDEDDAGEEEQAITGSRMKRRRERQNQFLDVDAEVDEEADRETSSLKMIPPATNIPIHTPPGNVGPGQKPLTGTKEYQEYQKQLFATVPSYTPHGDTKSWAYPQPIELNPTQIEQQKQAARDYKLSLMPGHDPDSKESNEAHSKKLQEYQMSLMTLYCGNPTRTTRKKMYRINNKDKHTASSPSNMGQPPALLSQDTDPTMPLAKYPANLDVLQDFDFDAFLHNDSNPGCEFQFSELSDADLDASKDEKEDKSAKSSETRQAVPSSTASPTRKDDVLFVNEKQFHRIIKRRMARQQLADQLATKRRKIGSPSTSEREARDQREGEANRPDTQITAVARNNDTKQEMQEPSPATLPFRPARSSTYPALSHLSPAQTSKLWWQAYISLVSTSSPESLVFTTIRNCLKHELGAQAAMPASDDICSMRVSSSVRRLEKAMHHDKPQLAKVLEIRSNILRIVTTVDEQLGLEIATLGWSCVYILLSLYEKVLNASPPTQIPATCLQASYSHLETVVAIIARYAVMENLYQQSGGALSLKPEYRAALISLCSDILTYFATAFAYAEHELNPKEQERELGEVRDLLKPLSLAEGGWQGSLQKCGFLVELIKQKDIACQGFKVVVDTKEESSDESESDEADVEDVSDEDWERIESAEVKVEVGVEMDTSV